MNALKKPVLPVINASSSPFPLKDTFEFSYIFFSSLFFPFSTFEQYLCYSRE